MTSDKRSIMSYMTLEWEIWTFDQNLPHLTHIQIVKVCETITSLVDICSKIKVTLDLKKCQIFALHDVSKILPNLAHLQLISVFNHSAGYNGIDTKVVKVMTLT